MGLFDENFKTLDNWTWSRVGNRKVTDLKEFIDSHSDSKFYIGTDSQKHSTRKKKGKKYWRFTTCLIAHNPRRGGSVLECSETVEVPKHLSGKLTREERLPVLRQRLVYEATKSIHVAWYLNEVMDSSNIEIHVDVNSDSKWDSSRYKDEIVGYVTSQGFACEHKPEAWAASWVADGRC